MSLAYGGVPVPNTASWSSETVFSVGACRFAPDAGPSILQNQAQGVGKPEFGKPHAIRQRQAIAEGLCDLCARSLKASTKVSLSHARVQPHGAEGPAVLQVEPLLHRRCAATSLRYCPSLKRDVRSGSVMIRQVLRYRVQFAVMSPTYVEEIAGQRCKAVGHAKVELLVWKDRDARWLEAA